MNYSKETIRQVDLLIRDYARYDRVEDEYVVCIDDIPEQDFQVLASNRMLDDPETGAEATGPDNRLYDEMALSLVKYLMDTKNKTYELDFLETWKKGITSYHKPSIIDLLEERLELYNQLKAA